jgi:hypothetical protein
LALNIYYNLAFSIKTNHFYNEQFWPITDNKIVDEHGNKFGLSYVPVGVNFLTSVKPVYNDHPWDPEKVAAVDRWSLFIGHLCSKKSSK